MRFIILLKVSVQLYSPGQFYTKVIFKRNLEPADVLIFTIRTRENIERSIFFLKGSGRVRQSVRAPDDTIILLRTIQ